MNSTKTTKIETEYQRNERLSSIVYEIQSPVKELIGILNSKIGQSKTKSSSKSQKVENQIVNYSFYY